jgi:hypothetical protein
VCYLLLSHLGLFSRTMVRGLSTPFPRPETAYLPLDVTHRSYRTRITFPLSTFPFLTSETGNLWVLGFQSPRDVTDVPSLPSVFFWLYARKVCPRSISTVASTVTELRIGLLCWHLLVLLVNTNTKWPWARSTISSG